MVRKSQYVIVIALCLVCLACFLLSGKTGVRPFTNRSFSAVVFSAMVYHFFHANIFHLCINAWGLASFRPRMSTVVVGFIASTSVALCPYVAMDEPTYGLSAFLFACYARSFARYRWKLHRIILPQIIMAFIPHMNWRIHILSFFLSYLFWRIYYDEGRV